MALALSRPVLASVVALFLLIVLSNSVGRESLVNQFAVDKEELVLSPSHISGGVGLQCDVLGAQERETVSFSLLMVGLDSAKEGKVLLKSAVMYTSSPLDFHIIVNKPSLDYLVSVFALLTHPVYPINVYFYPLEFPAMQARLNRTGWGMNSQNEHKGATGTYHWSGAAGMMKLFLHEILPSSVQKAIFVDTDAIFLTDPTLLWQQFSTFSETTLMAIPSHDNSEQPTVDKEWLGATRICSCVLLLHLQKMRDESFMYSSLFSDEMRLASPSPRAMLDMFGEPKGKNGEYLHLLGDQGYLWALKVYAPEMFVHLGLSWETTSCLWDMYGTTLEGSDLMPPKEQIDQAWALDMTPDEGKLITPGLIHFNGIFGASHDSVVKSEGGIFFGSVFYEHAVWHDPENWLNKAWGEAVRYHASFKFIWLNKGIGHAKTNVVVQTDLRFWDERWREEAEERVATAERGLPSGGGELEAR